ncbi:MAG TPA: hypothetical protein VJW20_24345 [Candidatus Angelobacter sp.]|nr:hypothetical protein [Candidatus Angelobacter sp.]
MNVTDSSTPNDARGLERKIKIVFGDPFRRLLGRNGFKHEVRLFIEADDYPAKIEL